MAGTGLQSKQQCAHVLLEPSFTGHSLQTGTNSSRCSADAPNLLLQELKQRRARIATAAVVDAGAAEDQRWDDFVIRGTCQTLDKSYFRLTAAPDPADVRPEPVLRRALERLVGQLAAEQPVKYLYALDQFKVRGLCCWCAAALRASKPVAAAAASKVLCSRALVSCWLSSRRSASAAMPCACSSLCASGTSSNTS